MLKKFVLTLSLIALPFFSSQASIFIEPVVGYANGSVDFEISPLLGLGSLGEKVDVRGLSYGGRAGIEFSKFQIGIDYMVNDHRVSNGDIFQFEDKEFKTKETALFLGYRFWFARIYAGLIFDTKLEDSELDSGHGYKAGLTFYALRNVALSVEYKEVDFAGLTSLSSFNHASYKNISFLLSFPFNFF